MRHTRIAYSYGFGLALRQAMAFLLALSLFVPVGLPQQETQNKGTRQTQTAISTPMPARPPDIISDNLDRVAASAPQILEVLTKEPGLMVELKRLIAQEAGIGGQILEESDLTDTSVADRLRTDLHTRVVATRLVQRYGYLVPRINPDSDLGAEQKLVQQERAQILARAAARPATPSETTPSQQNVACDPSSDSTCALPVSPIQGDESISTRPNAPARTPQSSSPLQRTEDIPQNDIMRPDSGISPDQRLEYASSSGSTTTVLTSLRDVNNPQSNAMIRPQPNGLDDGSSTGLKGQSDLQPFYSPQSEQAAALTGSRTVRNPATFGGVRNLNSVGLTPAEPVNMLRKPNPYANVPSLYDLYVQAAPNNRPAKRFGLDVFRKGEANPAYLPMDLPVGPSYVVGPGDSLAIDLWGSVSQRLLRTIDREGRVALPEAGPVLVSGRTLGDVQEEVQRVLRTQFRDISADVSLQKLRTVRVYVVGNVGLPGAYDVSSLSTPLNALFVAGGVTPQGSLRRLQHYRGKRLIEEVDAYDLLLHGIRGDLQRLENGDSLLVPSLGPVITVDGMVRRPALYELHGEKTLEEALDLAGGILPAAALRHIEVQRLVAHEKRTMLTVEIGETSDADAVDAKLRGFAVQDGDEIHIFPIAPYNTASIYLEGHVLRPGRYSYKPDMKLTDLIASYSDLLPEPSNKYAEIIRLHAPDFHPVVETFDLSTALEHPETAPKLEPLDTVRIYGRYDFEPSPEVFVTGEVRAPGLYLTSGQQHLRDAIYQAGGTTPDAWLDSAQLFRKQQDGSTRVFSVNLRDALAGEPLNNVLIQPRDRILVHRQPEQVSPATVLVRGDVAKPGRYPLAANMRVSDLVRSAGGLLRSANPESGELTHYATVNSSGEHTQAGHQDVNLAAALAGTEEQNLALHDGDVLTVPQQNGWNDLSAEVSIRGEIQQPGSYGIRPGERLSSVLTRAGGFNSQAYPYGAILTRREVRDLQMKSHTELIRRVKAEQLNLKALPESDTDQRNEKLTAIARTETTLNELETSAPIGRVVIHIKPDIKSWQATPADVPVRDGDILLIPKKADYVLVTGQVYNSTAVSFQPGRSAKWYLSQAGGLTQIADKKAVFVIRADGSVITAKNNGSGLWSGDPMGATLRPGDSIIVPEKTPKIGGKNWALIMQAAQLAASMAITVAYFHP
jgi:protein involved in polysaccharide export with SLBB domain